MGKGCGLRLAFADTTRGVQVCTGMDAVYDTVLQKLHAGKPEIGATLALRDDFR